MILADQIRQHVIDEIIAQAREAGRTEVRVRAGDVHQAMGLNNRMPAVCGALDAVKFYDQANIVLKQRSGPHQGANAVWVFSL